MIKLIIVSYIGVFFLIVFINGLLSIKEDGNLMNVLLMATLNVFWFVYVLFMLSSLPRVRKRIKKYSDTGEITGKALQGWGINPSKEDWSSIKNLIKILITKPIDKG